MGWARMVSTWPNWAGLEPGLVLQRTVDEEVAAFLSRARYERTPTACIWSATSRTSVSRAAAASAACRACLPASDFAGVLQPSVCVCASACAAVERRRLQAAAPEPEGGVATVLVTRYSLASTLRQ